MPDLLSFNFNTPMWFMVLFLCGFVALVASSIFVVTMLAPLCPSRIVLYFYPQRQPNCSGHEHLPSLSPPILFCMYLWKLFPPLRRDPIRSNCLSPFCAEYLLLSSLTSRFWAGLPSYFLSCLLLNPHGRSQLLLCVTPT